MVEYTNQASQVDFHTIVKWVGHIQKPKSPQSALENVEHHWDTVQAPTPATVTIIIPTLIKNQKTVSNINPLWFNVVFCCTDVFGSTVCVFSELVSPTPVKEKEPFTTWSRLQWDKYSYSKWYGSLNMSLGMLERCKRVFRKPIIQGLLHTHQNTHLLRWILWIYRIVGSGFVSGRLCGAPYSQI